MSYQDANAETSEVSCEYDTSVSNDVSKSDEIEGLSSENSAMDSSVWTKVQYLISTLKDVQLNLKEMGVLIADSKKQALLPHASEQNSEAKSSLTPLDVCIESPKTDEAKLNEILNLLHHIANTLSTYEQNPLLLANHSLGNADENENQKQEINPPLSLEFDRKDYYCIAKGGADNPLNSSLQSHQEESINHNLSTACTQTDSFLDLKLASNVVQDVTLEEKRMVTPKYGNQNSHAFSTQTKSLRKEIDDIIQRKEALDDRLQTLFRQKELPAKRSHLDQHGPSINEVHFEEPPLASSNPARRSREARKHRQRDKSVRKRGPDKTREASAKSSLVHDLCPTKLHLNNGDKIEELRHEEELFLGSTDDGLSCEINSLNLAIQEIVKENQHFYSFFQSIAAHNSLQEDVSHQKAVLRPELRDSDAPSETFRGEDILIEKNPQMEALNGSVEEHDGDTANLHVTDVADSAKREDPLVEGIDCKKLGPPVDEIGATSQPHHRHIIHQLAYEKKLNEERSSALEHKIDSVVEQSSHHFKECTSELEKVTNESRKLADQIDSLFVQNDELRTNIKNLGIHSSHPLSNQDPNKVTLQHREDEQASNCPFEPHKTCLMHIEKLVSQNQSLHRQLFLLKSQLSGGTRKNSYPGASKPSDKSSMHQYLLDGALLSCSTPASDLEVESEISRDFLKLSDGENSCLEDELEVLKTKVDYIESFMKNEANGVALSPSTESENKRDLESRIFLQPHCKKEVKEGTTTSEDSSCSSQQVALTDNSLLHKKIKLLLQEKQSLTSRLEELMVISQELAYHFKNTKEQLAALTMERDVLLKSITGSQVGSTQPDRGLAEVWQEQQRRTRQLESDLEKAWRAVHERALERDRIAAERDILKQSSDFAIANAKEEKASISELNAALEKQCKTHSEELSELRTLCNSKDDEIRQLGARLEASKAEAARTPTGDGRNSKGETANGGGFAAVDLSEEIIKRTGKEWQDSLNWLQKCLAEEKLHGRLLEAAEHESTTRVAVLQQALKETGNMYNELENKYQKLRKVLHARKSEKNKHKQVLKDCRGKVEELKSTTSALEDTYKVMLSTLGQNIGIAVDLLSSHLYLSPGSVHPSPELSDDPTFWFAAQCSRLRWLQAHLKRLGLRSWKGAGGPTEASPKELPKLSPFDLDLHTGRKKAASPSSAKSKSFDVPPSREPPELPVKQFSEPPSPANKALARAEKVVVEDDVLRVGSRILESNIWATLNDAEISLTSQQIRLYENKSKQIDSLVAILNRETGLPRGELSRTSSSRSRLSESGLSDPLTAGRSEETSTLKSSIGSEIERSDFFVTSATLQSDEESTLKSSCEAELVKSESNPGSANRDGETVNCT